jgi:hypothetical protein
MWYRTSDGCAAVIYVVVSTMTVFGYMRGFKKNPDLKIAYNCYDEDDENNSGMVGLLQSNNATLNY